MRHQKRRQPPFAEFGISDDGIEAARLFVIGGIVVNGQAHRHAQAPASAQAVKPGRTEKGAAFCAGFAVFFLVVVEKRGNATNFIRGAMTPGQRAKGFLVQSGKGKRLFGVGRALIHKNTGGLVGFRCVFTREGNTLGRQWLFSMLGLKRGLTLED